MINVKQSLKNLHKKFPDRSLDELFDILDCVVEESYFSPPTLIGASPYTVKDIPEIIAVTNNANYGDTRSRDIQSY